jgi:14-3-3 protein epsilon
MNNVIIPLQLSKAEEIEMSKRSHRSHLSKSGGTFSKRMEESQEDLVDNMLDPKLEAYDKVHFLSSMCLKFENYEDALGYVEEMVKLKETELTVEERDIFVTCYRYYISEKRTNWRQMYKLEEKEKDAKSKFISIMNEIKLKYEEFIIKACEKLIFLINTYIINKTQSNEGRAYFLKVKADHYRYMAEITYGQVLYKNRQNALQYYKEAYAQALYLSPLNCIRLGIALNYSVFFYEVLSNSINSLAVATEALNEALSELKTYSEEGMEDDKIKDSLIIIDQMKSNIHSWYTELALEVELEQGN